MEELEKITAKAEKDAPKNNKVDEAGNDKKDEYITIEDFAKIDLRVAKVLEAEKVEGAEAVKAKARIGR